MKETLPRIDSHHHFWDPTRVTYPWMVGDALDPIRRPFTPSDLAPEIAAQGISGTVLVQTISSQDETREFLELAERTDFIWGVVGWVDLMSAGVVDDLDALIGATGGDRLVGIRHQVHDESDAEWLCRADVRQGLAAVQERGLTYDLLVRARELPAAIDTVRALPGLQFVLDHIAKPRISEGKDPEWQQHMPALAALPNVAVKLSGMVTEACGHSLGRSSTGSASGGCSSAPIGRFACLRRPMLACSRALKKHWDPCPLATRSASSA